MRPSPSPRPLRRPRWPWFAGGALALLVLAFGALATYPRWASGLVRDGARSRLEARLGQEVEIDEVVLDYGVVELRGLRFGGADARVELDRVRVRLDDAALWRGRVRPVAADLRGGRIWGTERAFRELAGQIGRDPGREEASAETGRVEGMRPDRVSVEGVAVDLSLLRGEGIDRVEGRLRGVLSASWQAERPVVKLRIEGARLGGQMPGLGARELRAEALGSSIALVAEERFPLTLEVEGASTALTPEIALAKVRGRVRVLDPEASRFEVALDGGFADATGAGEGELWSFEGRGRRDLSEGELRLRMSAFELGRVPAVLRRLPLVDSADATVGGGLTLALSAGEIQAVGEIELTGLNLRHPLLARETVHDVGFGIDFDARLDPRRRTVSLERATLRRGAVAVSLSGELVHAAERSARRYALAMQMPSTPCQAVLEAIPGELAPGLRGFRLGGEMAVDLGVEVDFADLDALRLRGAVGIDGCQVRDAPRRAAASRMGYGFNHVVRTRAGGVHRVALFGGSRDFTRLDLIAPSMVGAVLTTEDAGFWRHHGFLPGQFEEALRRNLSAGRVRVGASTITMQLVKNVLLNHERTLSRKLQELFLTWYVERVLDKRRIMELYLNVVEFGPGVYGITHAARYYFGKHPASLTSLESAFLALMLPNPAGRHGMYCRDAITPAFEVKLRRIHGLMRSRGHIDDVDYLAWRDAALVFDPRGRGGEAQCLARSHALMQAEGIQTAVSGLLVDGPDAPVDDSPPPRDELPLPGVWEPQPTPAMDALEALDAAEGGREAPPRLLPPGASE